MSVHCFPLFFFFFQITETKKVLERALELSERLAESCESIQSWFSQTDSQLAKACTVSYALNASATATLLKEKYDEMLKMKEKVKTVQG